MTEGSEQSDTQKRRMHQASELTLQQIEGAKVIMNRASIPHSQEVLFAAVVQALVLNMQSNRGAS